MEDNQEKKTRELLCLYRDEQVKVLEEFPLDAVYTAVEMVWKAYTSGKTIYACGNGGNASFVGNLTVDLANHPFVSDDKSKPLAATIPRLRAIDLCANSATITGLMNDLGPEYIFSQQLINDKIQRGDVVFGFTGSGNSPNVLKAFEIAKKYEAGTIAITRGNGGKAKNLADLCIIIPGTSKFPGQIGGNDNNFHYEDSLSKITHMTTGILRHRISLIYNGNQ